MTNNIDVQSFYNPYHTSKQGRNNFVTGAL